MAVTVSQALKKKVGVGVQNKLASYSHEDDLGEWILVEAPQKDGTLFVQESQDVEAIAAIYHYKDKDKAGGDYSHNASELKTNRDQLRYNSHDYLDKGYDIINGERSGYEDTIHRYEIASEVIQKLS